MIDDKLWVDFMENGIAKDFDDNQSNVRYDFKKMTKRFGLAYREYLLACIEANPDMSLEELSVLNGNPPISYLEKLKEKT
jgi:hypothetical protein